MSNPFRTKAKVDEYDDINHKTSKEIKELADACKKKKQRETFKKFYKVAAEAYWQKHVEPELLATAGNGTYYTWITDLSAEFAAQLASFGSGLGFVTKSDHNAVRISWKK